MASGRKHALRLVGDVTLAVLSAAIERSVRAASDATGAREHIAHWSMLAIDLSEVRSIRLPAIAYLASLIDFRLSRGLLVSLTWPKPRHDNVEARSALARSEFADTVRAIDLYRCLSEFGSSPTWPTSIDQGIFGVQLERLTKDSFEWDRSSGVWRGSPKLTMKFQTRLTQQLRAGDLIDEVEVVNFANSLLLEAAWNAVLHSEPGSEGGGVSFMAGELELFAKGGRSARQGLSFAFADFGVGVASTLGKKFDSDATPAQREGSRRAAILRYALLPNTSSRPLLPLGRPDWGNRGLHEMSNFMRRGGELRIQSDSVCLVVDANADRIPPIERETKRTAPGVVIWGHLAPPSRAEILERIASANDGWELTAPLFAVAVDVDGSCQVDESVRKLGLSLALDGIAILDYYAGAARLHDFEAFIDALTEQRRNLQLVIVNCNVPFAQLRTAAIQMGKMSRPPLLISSDGEAVLLAEDSDDPDVAEACARLHLRLAASRGGRRSSGGPLAVELDLKTICELTKRVNTEYLSAGFASPIAGNGFVEGAIRLLNGKTVTRYFAIARNYAARADARERWSASFALGVRALLAGTHVRGRSTADTNTWLVGISAVPFELLQSVARRLGTEPSPLIAHVRAYDAPSRAEIAQSIPEGSKIVLLTDVVVSGRQLRAFRLQLERNNCTVIGAVAASDAMRRSVDVGAPLIALADFSVETTDAWDENALVVDEVSLEPRSVFKEDRQAVERVEETLALLRGSSAVRSGHIAEGNRHTDLYVDVPRLMRERREELIGRIRSVVEHHLFRRGWDGAAAKPFSPAIVVQPSGVSRIELGGRDGKSREARHRQALRDLTQRVVSSLGWSAESYQVSRRFDDLGNPRLPTGSEALAGIASSDVLIVDYAIVSGGTAKALLRDVARQGARRVLYVCLMSRLPLRELAWWEHQSSIRNEAGDVACEYQMAFPLVLPVPFYGESSCPIEAAHVQLREVVRDGGPPATVASSMLAEMLPIVRLDALDESTEQFEAGELDYRVIVEVAAEIPEATTSILSRTDTLRKAGRFDLLAKLLMRNQALLTRPRLREVLGHEIEEAASIAGRQQNGGHDGRLAMALLRSAFADRFAFEAEAFVLSASQDAESAERFALHLYTLDHIAQKQQSVQQAAAQLAEACIAALGAPAEGDNTERWRRAFVMVRHLSSPQIGRAEVGRTLHERLMRLRDVVGAPGAGHRARQYLAAFRRWQDAARTIAIPADTRANAPNDWASVVPYLLEELRSALVGCRELWEGMQHYRRQGIAGSRLDHTGLTDDDLKYLLSMDTRRDLFVEDVNQISFALEEVARARPLRGTMENLHELSNELLGRLVDQRSRLLITLRSITSYSVEAIIQRARERLRFYCSWLDEEVMRCGVSDCNASSTVLADPDVVDEVVDAIAANIMEHAFPDGFSAEAEVSVQAEEKDGLLHIRISHNGKIGNGPERRNTLELRGALEVLGGLLQLQSPGKESGMMRHTSTISLAVWNGGAA